MGLFAKSLVYYGLQWRDFQPSGHEYSTYYIHDLRGVRIAMRVLVHVGTVVNNKLQRELQWRAFIDLPLGGGESISI